VQVLAAAVRAHSPNCRAALGVVRGHRVQRGDRRCVADLRARQVNEDLGWGVGVVEGVDQLLVACRRCRARGCSRRWSGSGVWVGGDGRVTGLAERRWSRARRGGSGPKDALAGISPVNAPKSASKLRMVELTASLPVNSPTTPRPAPTSDDSAPNRPARAQESDYGRFQYHRGRQLKTSSRSDYCPPPRPESLPPAAATPPGRTTPKAAALSQPRDTPIAAKPARPAPPPTLQQADERQRHPVRGDDRQRLRRQRRVGRRERRQRAASDARRRALTRPRGALSLRPGPPPRTPGGSPRRAGGGPPRRGGSR
jgi:hypothetical protein